jgi:histidinol dehydrogenase
MATPSLSLEERLSSYPQLRERIEALLAIVEDPTAEMTRADEAERQVIAEVRRLGNEALCSWAAHHEAAQRATVEQPGTARAGKKNSTGIQRSGKSAWSSNSSGRRAT